MRACKLTTKFQTTIPKEIRQKLSLTAGDRVNFEIHETGNVVVTKAQNIQPMAKKVMVPRPCDQQQPQLVVPSFGGDDVI